MFINDKLIPGHEVIRSLWRGPLGSVLLARSVEGSRREVAVKTRSPVFAEGEDQPRSTQGLENFLKSARLQQKLAATDSHWAPIFKIGSLADESGGAFYSSVHFPASAAWLIRGRIKLPAPVLKTVITDVVDGLAKMRSLCNRGHGNLKPENVLLTAREVREARAVLTDPSPEPAAESDADISDDGWAVGALIYAMVTHKQARRMMLLPLEADESWAELGASAGHWLKLCNRLLSSDARDRTDSTTLRNELARIPAARRGGIGVRAGVIAAAVVLVGGAAVLYWQDRGAGPVSSAVVPNPVQKLPASPLPMVPTNIAQDAQTAAAAKAAVDRQTKLEEADRQAKSAADEQAKESERQQQARAAADEQAKKLERQEQAAEEQRAKADRVAQAANQQQARIAAAAQIKITVAPLNSVASPGSAAVFMGVNQFTDDDSLRPLHFAVDDAIAQAHLFVIELKLITPGNCYLALGGEPSSDAVRLQLKQLVDAGVHGVAADRTSVIRVLAKAQGAAERPSDMLIASFSSHGFEEGSAAYVLPSDGSRGLLADTGLRLDSIEQRVGASKATKRLLLVDACQESATSDTKGGDTPMGDAFKSAFAQASGEAVVASCAPGQVSYENGDLHHGLFTFYLLQAFNGGAPVGERGNLTLGDVCDYVSEHVRQWVVKNKHGIDERNAQSPWFSGQSQWRTLVLAVDPKIAGKFAPDQHDLKDLLNELHRQVDVNGPVTPELYTKLERMLHQLDLADVDDQGVLSTVGSFVYGTTPPSVFVPNLQNILDHLQERLIARLSRQANSGNSEAMWELGHNYETGQGVARDDAVAMSWYRKAADAGSTEAMDDVGNAYETGRGVAKDRVQAMVWYRKAADAGNALGILKLGDFYYAGKDYVRAMEWGRRAADAGNTAGMNDVGTFYLTGLGVTRDYEQAMIWFRKAADAGNPHAMGNIGVMYGNGLGVTCDYGQAMSWYRKAADAGSAFAMCQVGDLYDNGQGAPQDYEQAMAWYRKAADAGNTSAMIDIARFYTNGRGVARDDTQGTTWYRKAANAGNAYAKNWLSLHGK